MGADDTGRYICVHADKMMMKLIKFASALGAAAFAFWAFCTPIAVAAEPGVAPVDGASRVSAKDLSYVGAFRLPEGGERPKTFAYGGNAMTFNPDGDPSGPRDDFPGSLFVTGHDRMPYGELPDGTQVAEVSIPQPIMTKQLNRLNRAGILQRLHDVAKGRFHELSELPRVGLQYLKTPGTGAKVHIAWGQHLEPEPSGPTHGWFEPNLTKPNFQGEWFIGNRSFYSVNGYMFAIPKVWAERYGGGRVLATGRFRDGGWSGMGPALIAYRPWRDAAGTPAPPGTRLE